MSYEIMATLWPEMPHYKYFAADPRISGIRLNTAKASVDTIDALTKQAVDESFGTPIYFDVKGRQLRVESVEPNEDHLEIDINNVIEVNTPCVVLFKGGTDPALLIKVEGKRLIFEGGPEFMVTPGDSLNIRDNSLKVHGDLIPEKQLKFLETAQREGITRFMLSYAQSAADVNQFRKLLGKDCEIICKIEDQEGLDFAKREFKAQDAWNSKNLGLLTARGDLYVELEKPHDIIKATSDLIRYDKNAIIGSRILLSVTEEEVPSCADLHEIAWLLQLGYHRFMFCDGLCLNKAALNRSVNILAAVIADWVR
jgi:pyruvate kinase